MGKKSFKVQDWHAYETPCKRKVLAIKSIMAKMKKKDKDKEII